MEKFSPKQKKNLRKTWKKKRKSENNEEKMFLFS